MEKLKNWLKSYGLNPTEITIYLFILEHAGCKTAEIQRETGLVRTTIYYTLAQLKTAGLISDSEQNNVRTYRATDSSALENSIESVIAEQNQRLEQLAKLQPLLNSLGKKQTETDSFVARFEGVAPIKQALEQAFRCNSKRWHVIASRDNFLYHSSAEYKKYYLSERKRRGVTAKTLWEPTDGFKTPTVEDVFYRNPRRLPEEFKGTFSSLVILYDDTTLIIDSYEQKTAHAIHNKTSTHLLRMLHESIWKNAALENQNN